MRGRWKLFLMLVLVPGVFSCADKSADERFSTPIETYRLWLKASLEEDVAGSMECITVASRKFMDIQTKDRDVFVERMTKSAGIFNNFSVADERIKGNKAVIVIREPKSGNAIAIPFLYEDNGWKVDLIAMFSAVASGN